MPTVLTPLRLAIALAVAAVATSGCVTTGGPGFSPFAEDNLLTTQAPGTMPPAVETKSRTARVKSKKGPAKNKTATAAAGQPQGAGPVDEDLWQRIREGLQIEAPDHPRLEAARRWLEEHPQYLTRLAENAEPFIYLVTEQVEERDMPLELALLPVIESAYNPAATSHKNAAGIWQFMPGTARERGLRQDSWYDGRRDVVASTDAALGYLQYLSDRFDGDWHLALAAYNAGEGTIRRAIERNARRGRPTDYWSLDLPGETKRYVPKLLAVSEAVANAEGQAAPLPAIKNSPKLAAIEAPTQIDISTASSACDVPESALRAYNPALRRGATSPDGPHRLLLPVDEAHRCQHTLLASGSPDEARGWTRHLSFRGEAAASPPSPGRALEDSLGAFGGAVVAAAPASPAPEAPPGERAPAPAVVAAPQPEPAPAVVAIEEAPPPAVVAEQVVEDRGAAGGAAQSPPSDEPRLSARTLTKDKAAKEQARTAATVVAVKAEPSKVSLPPRQHRVRDGETLYSIARQYKVDVDDLKRWNKIKGDRLVEGQSLSLTQGEGLRRL